MKIKPKNISLIVSLASLMGGIGFIVASIYNISFAMKSENWPTTEANILNVDIEKVSMKAGYQYEIKILYEYYIENKRYISNRYSFGESETSDKYKIEKLVNKLKGQKNITVFYNPNDPNTSVIETGMQWRHWKILFFSVLFLGLGIFFFMVYRGLK